jgi:acetyl esterase/lipase
MPLTASVEQFLARRAGAGAVRIDQLPLHQARDYFARFAPLADVAARPVHTVEDVTFDARDGTALAARVYYPRTPDWTNPLPALLYFHSGGYVVGTLETADAVCRFPSTTGLRLSTGFRARCTTPSTHCTGCIATPARSHWTPGGSRSAAKARVRR